MSKEIVLENFKKIPIGVRFKKGHIPWSKGRKGLFRGWICFKCNCALGMVEDNPEILIEMIKYINKNK
jgi:hypothetical protein